MKVALSGHQGGNGAKVVQPVPSAVYGQQDVGCLYTRKLSEAALTLARPQVSLLNLPEEVVEEVKTMTE